MALQPSDLDDIDREILGLAAYDYMGLYEIIWRLNVVLPGSTASSEILDTAARHVHRLIVEGWLDLYRWDYKKNDDGEIVPPDTALQLVADPRVWETPQQDERLVVGASEAARRIYGTRWRKDEQEA